MNRRVFRSGPYADLMVQGVQAGKVLYLSGQVGVDADGRAPEPRRRSKSSLSQPVSESLY